MLNRYLAGKQADARGPKQKRPYLASECTDLVEADKWRQQILRDVGKKVMEIQNAGLGEHRCGARPAPPATGTAPLARAAAARPDHAAAARLAGAGSAAGGAAAPAAVPAACSFGRPRCRRRIRDLNDEINKLIREKGHWERRIVELGGPDYAKSAPKVTDMQVGRAHPPACTRLPAAAQALPPHQPACLAGHACGRPRLTGLSLGLPPSPHHLCRGPRHPCLPPPPPPMPQGNEIAEASGRGGGYRYFGAAKQLPGVKELFEKEAPRAVRRSRHQMCAPGPPRAAPPPPALRPAACAGCAACARRLADLGACACPACRYKGIDPDYYGFRDEEDGVLERVEAEAEKLMRAEVGAGGGRARCAGCAGCAGCSSRRHQHPGALHAVPPPRPRPAGGPPPTSLPPRAPQAILEWEQREQERSAAAASVAGGAVNVQTGDEDAPEFVAYVPLPDQKDIELRILEKKKRDLLAKYTSDSLQQEQEAAKAMLNKR